MKSALFKLMLFWQALFVLTVQQAHAHMPSAPSGLTATAVSGGITLSWTAPSNPNEIAGYNVYRCEEGETPCLPALIKWVANPGDTPPPPTSYTDDGSAIVNGEMIGMDAGTTYRYEVSASHTMDYHESARSNAVTVLAEGGAEPEPEPEPEPEVLPAAPTGLMAVSGESGIDLSWAAPSDDIVGYSIYRCEEGEIPCTLEWLVWVANEGDAPPAPTSYTDTDVTEGTTYRYAVTSNNVDSDGEYHESEWSDDVTALAEGGAEPEPEPEPGPSMVPPASPTGFTAISGASGIDLSWNAPSDDIAGYSIYRCEEGDTPCAPEWIAWVANEGDAPPAPTSYTDTDVTEGTTYRYAVTSNNVDSDGEYQESEWSDEVTAVVEGSAESEPEPEPEPGALPAPPMGFMAVSGENGIDLSWTAPSDDIVGYSIYRCEEGETPCVPEWIAWVANEGDTPPAPTSYTDTDVTEGTIYRYAVTSNTADSDGEYHESDWSDEVTVLAEGSAEPEPEPELAAPTGLMVTETSAESVSLSWDAPADGILGYNVYRCEVVEDETVCEPEWHAWVANEGDAPPAPTTYTDTGGDTGEVTPGTTYLYTVSASYPPDYENSEQSEAVTAVTQDEAEPEPEPEPEDPEVTPAEKQAALEDVSATIGRNMLSSVVTTIGNRFTDTQDTSKFSLAGRQVTLDDLAARVSSETGWDSVAVTSVYAGGELSGNVSVFEQVAPHNHGRTISWRQLLGDSVFLMSFGGGGENSRQLNLWGSGDIQSFDGDSHDGDLYTGYLGADLRIRQNMLAGVSVSHSVADAGYIIDDQEGKLDTELTTVLPYARLLLNDRTEVWAIAGAGWGEAKHNDGSVRESTDLSVALGAFGGRRTFGLDSGGMNWAVRADAAFIRLWTDEGMQTVDDLAVNASQLRLGLEASHPFILDNSAMVRPFADVGVRYDGGDGNNTGAGVELASGLRYDDAASGLWLEARGRMLVLHSEDSDYEEQGFSLSAGLQPYNDGTGLSLLVSPRWGGSVKGTEAMLRPDVSGLYNRGIGEQRRRGSLHTELSYGFAEPETGGVTTPFAEFDVTDGAGYRAKLGTRYQLLSGGNTLKFELSSDLTTMPVHAVSTLDADSRPSHEVWLTAELQGLPFTTSDGRRRRSDRILAQADSVDNTTTDVEEVEASEDIVEIEEIRVTGSRFQRSLSDALDEKRRASEIIEAISAEDIGALPDTSVAESLARLPGVSYTRNAFGANNVSIRGLGAVLTNGTLNDRDLATQWGDRSVSFNMFPAELISRASLYKAPSASHVEGGIGGTLNLRTARALEWGERYVAVNVRGRYNDLAGDLPGNEEFGYRGSIAYLDQFAGDTVGIAIGYAGQHSPLVGADAQVYDYDVAQTNIDGIADGFGGDDGFNVPWGSEYSAFDGASDRHSVMGTIQWKPVENFEVNIDAFFSSLTGPHTYAGLKLGGLNARRPSGHRWSNVETFADDNVTGATVTCLRGDTNRCMGSRGEPNLNGFAAVYDDSSKLHSYGIEGKWSAGELTLMYDFSWSRADGEDSWTEVGYRPYDGLPGSLQLVRPVSTFGENEAGAAFLTSPLDFTDLATNRVDFFFLRENEREDEIFTYKFDAEYTVDHHFLTAFKAGVRLVNRNNLLDTRVGSRDPSPESSAAITPDFVSGVYDQSQVGSAFDASPVLVLDARAIRNTVFADIEARDVADAGPGHFIEEDVKAWYVQADFETNALFGIPASGNFGVRVVTTDVDTQGRSAVEGRQMPVSTSDKYTEVLPSANINFFPTEEVIVRLAGSRVLARPAITFLTPGTEKWGDSIYGGANGGGNPFLRPFIANQFDLSLERYFDSDTGVALAFYFKDMDTFITSSRVESGPPDDRVVSYLPANRSGGHVLGIEATAQHTFAGLLPEGYGDVGVYATYTWTDSNIELSETFNSGRFGLDGQSKHLGNVTLHYHRDKLDARVSYRYRSEFTRPQRPARAFTINRAEGDLSFQVSYQFNKQFRFFVEGWGLLNEARDNFHGLEGLQGQYTLYGRNIQAGASYRF